MHVLYGIYKQQSKRIIIQSLGAPNKTRTLLVDRIRDIVCAGRDEEVFYDSL